MKPQDMGVPPDQSVARPDLAREPVDLGQDSGSPDMRNGGPPVACNEYTSLDDDRLCGVKEECEAFCEANSTGLCMIGSTRFDEATCQAECVTEPVTACQSGDGCCPNGCIAPDDDDCRTPVIVDLCQEPVFPEDLGGKAVVLDEVNTSNLCCKDFDGDGLLDNTWMREFLSGGTAAYNTYLDAAYEQGLVHIVLEFGELQQSEDLSGARELRQYIGVPQCFSQIDQSQIRVYRPDADISAIRFDSVSVGKSLPPRLTATASELLFPMYGIDQDIFYAKIRGVEVRATVSEDGQSLFNGELDGYVLPRDYFSAVNDYYEQKCPCFGESMFDIEDLQKGYSCNDLSGHSCQGTVCESSVGICPGMISKFRINADIDSSNPNDTCEPLDTPSPTCDAISIGLKFDTRDAYLSLAQ